MKILVSVPDSLIEDVDKQIDGKKFRTRSQFVSVLLADWLVKDKYPSSFFANQCDNSTGAKNGGSAPAVISEDGRLTTLTEARNLMRRRLLGDDWDRYQHSNALVFEEDESGEVNRQLRELEHNQDEMKARIEALEAAIAKISGAPATQPEEPQNESRKSKRGQAAKPKGSK